MDYTMFIPISRGQLNTFDKQFYKPNNMESRGMQFKNYLMDHL